MVNSSLIPSIKKACVGMGLRRKGEPFPLGIAGTGFIIDPAGYVITADHVYSQLKDIRDQANSEGDNVEIAAFMISLDDEKVSLTGNDITKKRTIKIQVPALQDSIPEEHDVVICRLYGKWGNLPSLRFKKPTKLEIYTEILMCGYPGGNVTLEVSSRKYGLRVSPIIQTGRISSLMPADNFARSGGILTDIVGTGGSSGSPIVDANDGEVIGIAQRVISAEVIDSEEKLLGNATIGLVWGVSNYLLYDACYRMIEAMKKTFNELGEPLPDYPEVLEISFKAGEGSFPEFKQGTTQEEQNRDKKVQ